MRQPTGYTKLWKDINRALWECAVAYIQPRNFIRAELWRRVDHARILEKSASIRMARRNSGPSPIFRACCWIVDSSTEGDIPAPSPSLPQPRVSPEGHVFPGATLSKAPQADHAQSSDHYQRFVDAFFYAARAAEAAGVDPKKFDFEFIFSEDRWVVHGTPQNPLCRLHVNFFYLTAGPRIWKALFDAIVHKDLSSRRIAEKYAQSTAAQNLLAVYCDISPLKTGDVYNLDALFDDLNTQYFDGLLPRPMLAWTTRATYRTLGTYNFFWGILCLSRILNDSRVPELAVRFVLYHEMVHIKHGAKIKNSKLMSHTPEFKADEQRFEGYEEAEKIRARIRDIVK